MKRRTFPAVAAILIAVTAIACGSNGKNEQTLRFTDRAGEMTQSVDALRSADEVTPGDQIVDTRQLLDGSGKRVGTVHQVCAATSGRNDDATVLCSGVVELADGKLSFAKTNKLSGDFEPAPVTGGTGTYEGATGTITAVQDKVEIHLFLP
jgi:hypothetical protein